MCGDWTGFCGDLRGSLKERIEPRSKRKDFFEENETRVIKNLLFKFILSYLGLKNMRHNFKNLKIWILAMNITNDIYKLTLTFPKFEIYSLTSQMNRCSVSMPSNIAEGSNRGNKHFQHYLNISLGSSFELQTQLLIAYQNEYLTKEKTEEIENKIIEFQKMTTGFISKLG